MVSGDGGVEDLPGFALFLLLGHPRVRETVIGLFACLLVIVRPVGDRTGDADASRLGVVGANGGV